MNNYDDDYSKFKYQVAFGLMGCANFTVVARDTNWDIKGAGVFSVPEMHCEEVIEEIHNFNRGRADRENWEWEFPHLNRYLPELLEHPADMAPWELDTLELKMAVMFGSAGGPLGAAPQLIFTEDEQPIESYV